MKRFRSHLRRLPVRLIALLSLALFPLGLIALFQTQKLLEEARTINRASLMERTLAAASEERELIQRALGAAQGMASVILSVDRSQCDPVMRDFIDNHPEYIFAGYVDSNGQLLCTSRGEAMDLSNSPAVQRAVKSEEPTVEASVSGAVTGQPIVYVTEPVRRNGRHEGFVAISIPLQLANELMQPPAGDSQLKLAVVNLRGVVLTATGGVQEATNFLPSNIGLPALVELDGRTFRTEDGLGETRIFAVGSVIEGSAVVVGSWPAEIALDGDSNLGAWAPLAFPGLMWMAGMLVAYFGVQRLVIRHITKLRSAMRQYALGELRGGRIELDNAPEELRETERAFNRMVLLLAQAEAQQEQDLRDKEVLLREVHHRVKNNLQLIASIMNMMSRNARAPEARRMLDGLQRRVRGLAMLHRTLYTTPEMTTVDGADMLEALVADVTEGTRLKDLDIQTELTSVALYPDQAVPLSMILAEAMTNAVKYSGYPEAGGPAFISVFLGFDEDTRMVTLQITNSRGRRLVPEEDGEGDGLGKRLMQAFERQLGGLSETEDLPDRYVYTLRFERDDFDGDEEE